MTRYALTSLLMMLLCLTQVISAQTPTPEPAPWPPDPSEIFAEGVQWAIFDESTGKSIIIDKEMRIIQVKDGRTETWRDYAFPEGKEIRKAEIQPDGRIRVSWSYEDVYNPDSTLLLNQNTGLYEQPETLCEGKVLQVPNDQGQWVALYHEGNYEDLFLCHSSTGEQREDLPTGFTNWHVLETLDDQRLIMAMGGTSQYQVFVYHLSDSSLISLGTVDNGYDNDLSICDWLTDTRGLLCSTNREDNDLPTTYYEFDITQENSINEVFYAWPESLLTLDNPKRYFVMYSTEYTHHMFGGASSLETFKPCTLLVYDATGSHEHVLGHNCIPMLRYSRQTTPYYGGIPFYYLISDAAYTTSSLYRYDIRSETASEPLFTGEIETVLSVSPDERYIVLVLDDDGRIGFEWHDTWCCMGVWQVAILDTRTEEIIYRSEPIGVYMADQIIWLDDRNLVIVASGAVENMGTSSEDGEHIWREIPTTLRRIQLQEDNAVTTEITQDYGFSASFDFLNVRGHYWLTLEENTLIDLNTFETVPLLRDDISPQYYVSAQWNWDSPYGIKVTVSMRDENAPRRHVSYLVSLPE